MGQAKTRRRSPREEVLRRLALLERLCRGYERDHGAHFGAVAGLLELLAGAFGRGRDPRLWLFELATVARWQAEEIILRATKRAGGAHVWQTRRNEGDRP
jgi:hypothetical protein